MTVPVSIPWRTLAVGALIAAAVMAVIAAVGLAAWSVSPDPTLLSPTRWPPTPLRLVA